ncbi:MAG: ATP-binding cassette domain-containing protein, partial [Kiloniellales bacterium]
MIEFADLSVTYRGDATLGAVHALRSIDLDVAEGEFVSLIGPSGCGKSTMLRVAADLLEPSGGRARVAGVSPRETRLARRIGMVFQDPALLEWRSVLGNVLLPLEIMGRPRAEARKRALEMIALVGLAGFEQAR